MSIKQRACCTALTFFLFLISENPNFQELFEEMDPRRQPDDLQLADVLQINTIRINRRFEYGVHEYGFITDPLISGEDPEDDFFFDPIFQTFHVYERLGAKPIVDAERKFLYLPKKIKSFRMRQITNPYTGNAEDKLDLTVFYRRELPISEQVPFFNDFFNHLQYNANQSIMSVYRAVRKMDLINYWLSSSPGEVIEISEGQVNQAQEQQELIIKSDISARVANQNNVYELMKLFQPCGEDFGEVARAHFVGCVIKVIYEENLPEYNIGDIDETVNPSSMFDWNGEELSFTEFFAREHNIEIKDNLQPLLINLEYVPEERKVSTEV